MEALTLAELVKVQVLALVLSQTCPRRVMIVSEPTVEQEIHEHVFVQGITYFYRFRFRFFYLFGKERQHFATELCFSKNV